MAVSADAASCMLIWSPRDMTLDDLAKFMSLLDDLHSGVAVPYVTENFASLSHPEVDEVSAQSPSVTRVNMGSPLVDQLLAGSGGVLSLGMVGSF